MLRAAWASSPREVSHGITGDYGGVRSRANCFHGRQRAETRLAAKVLQTGFHHFTLLCATVNHQSAMPLLAGFHRAGHPLRALPEQ